MIPAEKLQLADMLSSNYFGAGLLSSERVVKDLYTLIIHLIRAQNFPKNHHFLLPDTHTYVCLFYYLAYSGESKVSGGYTDWSTWSPCPVTCGLGVQARTRTCTNPSPSGSGLGCGHLGKSKEVRPCATEECEKGNLLLQSLFQRYSQM